MPTGQEVKIYDLTLTEANTYTAIPPDQSIQLVYINSGTGNSGYEGPGLYAREPLGSIFTWRLISPASNIYNFNAAVSTSLGFDSLRTFRKEFTSVPQIRTLNSAPVDLLPAPPTGYAIVGLEASVDFTANTTPYTSSAIDLVINGKTAFQFRANVLSSGVSKHTKFTESTTYADMIEGAEKMVVTSDSDSAVGDGTFILYGSYRLVKLSA